MSRSIEPKPIGIGIVGCGNAMDGAYMPVVDRLQHQGKARLVGVTHSSRRAARALLKKWRIPKYFDTLEELLASDDIDVVVVLTPMIQHAAIAGAALAAGKHVLVEKPPAVTLNSVWPCGGSPRKAARSRDVWSGDRIGSADGII